MDRVRLSPQDLIKYHQTSNDMAGQLENDVTLHRQQEQTLILRIPKGIRGKDVISSLKIGYYKLFRKERVTWKLFSAIVSQKFKYSLK